MSVRRLLDLQRMVLQRKIGASVSQTIDGTERILDCTSLATSVGYPMTVRVMARSEGCYIYQGGSTVALPTTKCQMIADTSVELTIDSASDAYFAVQRNGSSTGYLIATRIDNGAA